MRSDILIIGGGLVGLAAALALARQGRQVRLLESADLHPAQPARLDARSLALSHSSAQILRALGLWSVLQAHVSPIRHIHVSSAGHFGVTRLHASDLDLDAMGYVVEYHDLMRVLLDAAKGDDRIDILAPARFKSLQQDRKSVVATADSADQDITLQAALVLIADGAQSAAREALGIDARITDFQQQAIIANVGITSTGQGVAYERFTDRGPLALLPLTDQRYALVWTNPQQRADHLLQLSDRAFLAALHEQFGYRLGVFDRVGARDRFPLKLTRARQLVDGRCVVIGNAANTLHPVAGQGFNLALRDVAALYDLLEHANLVTEECGVLLQTYPEQRKQDQDRAVGLSSTLVGLFSNNLPLLGHMRAGALAALDLCPLLKHEFSWQGMGYGGRAFSLMRGAS